MTVQEALSELRVKTLLQIQSETCVVWANRATAAFTLAYSCVELPRQRLLYAAEEFLHEAIEHAALAEGALSSEAAEALAGARKARANWIGCP